MFRVNQQVSIESLEWIAGSADQTLVADVRVSERQAIWSFNQLPISYQTLSDDQVDLDF